MMDDRNFMPFETLQMHITASQFFIEPLEQQDTQWLTIDRISQEITMKNKDPMLVVGAELKTIYGIFGIARLLAGPYLVVITRRTKVGDISDASIWRIQAMELVPFKRTLLHLTDPQKLDNSRYLGMIELALATDSYYYSTTYDLTHSMQRLYDAGPDLLHKSFFQRADDRFTWNSFLMTELSSRPEMSRYCLPVMLGFVSISTCTVKGRSFRYALISRRSRFRAGTRYNVRGVDAMGKVANFIETEQIVEYETSKCSFVQTRGSIPLFWYQYPDLSYKPIPVITTSDNQMDGFVRHFTEQTNIYGSQVVINLLDQKGNEKKLVDAYTQHIKLADNAQVRYEPFDFHKECRKMQWHRLSVLMDRINDDQTKFEYFMVQGESVKMLQSGVFRTNCIDCLDRTNVVQSLLAKRSLAHQLQKLGVLSLDDTVENNISFDRIFQNVWADNADMCSKQYAGTGALKTDFTRLGKRTRMGMLRDGYNSLSRYILNNFYDGFRQDATDLLLGNYVIDESEGITKSSPLHQERDWKFYGLPAIFIVAFSMCVISILIPDEHIGEQLMYVFFWGGASLITLGFIYYYGKEFVDRPKLVQNKQKTE